MKSADFCCRACGAEIHPNAKACRACGADKRSGWAEDADEIDSASAAGVPDDDDFDYDNFIREEFGDAKAPSKKDAFKIVVAFVVVAALLVSAGLGGCLGG